MVNPAQDGHDSPEGDTANPIKAARAADDLFNLGSSLRPNAWNRLSGFERDTFVSMAAELAQRGVIGFEILEVDGRPYKSFAVNQIGDSRTSHAPLYDRNARLRW
jgi:hypothetical protein